MNKKRVFITGGTSGMGKAASKLFLEKEWEVVVADINELAGKKVVEEFEELGYKNIFFVKCDVSKDEDMKRAYQFSKEKIGGIDCVINNAGIWHGGMLHETTDEEWDRLFNVDVKSIYLSTKYFVPDMIERKYGNIINTASISGLYGDYNMAAYNAAKGAVTNLVKAMALDYGKFGIRVNNVCPSACATPMFLTNQDPEVIKSFQKTSTLGRLCTPEDIARAMYFLASDESSFITGVNLPVSGGMDVHTGQPVQDENR
ncbi:SDR family NAD(P)-dependent oxidoreductase [Cetobacterium sp.]|uniref:SDR family NAD(P)-dependent oxidoreductase n=1 Tax=Cetobacterium sp. TaxID=2071632 RepID=UPI003F37EE54